jgi:spore coat-associated protein N
MRTRLRIIASQPRLALGALVTLLLAAGAVAGSGADFTASSANPTNTFAAGTLSIVNSQEGEAVLEASGLRPGDAPVDGFVDIRNSGSLSGDFELSLGALSNSDPANPLAGKLNLTVVDCDAACGDAGDSELYDGTLAAMGTIALGEFAANDEHRYRFEVALDGSAGNAYQGGSATATFDFDAS